MIFYIERCVEAAVRRLSPSAVVVVKAVLSE
jgi:hypothetical protein